MKLAWLCAHSDKRHAGKGVCKNCYMREYYLASPITREKARVRAAQNRASGRTEAYNRARYLKDPTSYKAKGKKYRDANKGKLLANTRKMKYGLSQEDQQKLYEEQSGLCAICEVSEKDAPKQRLHLDHDHTTRKIRGFLCNSCNLVTQQKYTDDPSLLLKAYEYVTKHSKLSTCLVQ